MNYSDLVRLALLVRVRTSAAKETLLRGSWRSHTIRAFFGALFLQLLFLLMNNCLLEGIFLCLTESVDRVDLKSRKLQICRVDRGLKDDN